MTSKFSSYNRKIAWILSRRFGWDFQDAKDWCLYKRKLVRFNFARSVSTIDVAYILNNLKRVNNVPRV